MTALLNCLPETKPPVYVPYGMAKKLLHTRRREVVIAGPAGTGKSVACLWKLHLLAESVPGFKAAIVRKTRASIADSALASFEQYVLPLGHPVLDGPTRGGRQYYRYPNGSEIKIRGMDKPYKTLSTENDIVFVQEAIELEENDWELLTRSLRHRAIPYQQIIADTNPDRPTHWLKKRCEAGKTLLLESRHQDNPMLWDQVAQKWTAFGEEYIATLDALTGPRKARLRYGRWVQSEGVVYEEWDAAKHIVNDVYWPNFKRFLAGVDWGFTAPGVILVAAIDGDGRITIVAEIYHTGRTLDWWIAEAKKLKARWPGIFAWVCDPSEPANIEQWKRAGLNAIVPPVKAREVSPGIDAVRVRLKEAKDGRVRLQYLRGCSLYPDPALKEQNKPMGLVEEMDAYILNPDKPDEPIKENDHACDALRYLVSHLDLGGPHGPISRPQVILGSGLRP